HVRHTEVAGSDAFVDDVLVVEKDGNSNLNIISDPSSSVGVLFSDNARAKGRLVYHHSSDQMQLWTNGSLQMSIKSNGTVGIGTANPNQTYKLDVAGKVRACEVVVEASNWCDYVFEDNYNLMPLDELEIYLKKNKHLPNIPPAIEVENNGLKLAQMNVKMMEKIEELTLYIIKQNKRVEQQGKKIKELERVLSKLDEKSK
ncbi:hypothetical protein JYU20_03035, partial [Bacteroidales bacterium AH-315-I05]|nr:hypothetical protein [Bacteroidales bacterium AH-315-I05]